MDNTDHHILRTVEKDLTAHLKECALKSEMVWKKLGEIGVEQRDQRRLLYGILAGVVAMLVSVVGYLATRGPHV